MGTTEAAGANQSGNQTVILVEEDNDRHALRLELLKGGLECRCSVTPKSKSGQLTKDELLELLATQGITQGLIDNQVQALCRTVAKGKSASNYLLAEGKVPKPGPDGYLELFVRASSDSPHYHEDEDGNIDFRTLNFFSNVLPGKDIGVVQPPRLGDEGFTVTGETLAAVSGKPLKLTAGPGCSFREDGKTVLAEFEGRVIYDGKTVSVTEEYVVQGDVNLAVGHIDFRGFVEVKGDVLDDFNLHAGKGLQINGNAGMCDISSPADIAIGGMAGQGRGRITCGGNLVVTYLNDVTVECDGNVVVKNEIRNSRIYCSGTVTIANGGIFGGETYALRGIEAKNVGAASGIKTRLYAGIDYVQIKLADQLDDIQVEFIEANDELALLSFNLKQNKTLGAEDKKKVLNLSARMDELNQLKAEIDEKMVRAKELAEKNANGKINIKSHLGEGVVLHIGDAAEEIKLERTSATSIIENRKAGGFHYLSLTPLSKPASDLEQALAEDEAPDTGGEWGQ